MASHFVQNDKWGRSFLKMAEESKLLKMTDFARNYCFPQEKVMIKKELLQHGFHAATAQALYFCNFDSFNMGTFFRCFINGEDYAHHHGVGIRPVKSCFFMVHNSANGNFFF